MELDLGEMARRRAEELVQTGYPYYAVEADMAGEFPSVAYWDDRQLMTVIELMCESGERDRAAAYLREWIERIPVEVAPQGVLGWVVLVDDRPHVFIDVDLGLE